MRGQTGSVRDDLFVGVALKIREPATAIELSEEECWKHSPEVRVKHEAVGLIKSLDDGVLKGTVQSGYVDLLLVGVVAGPEEVPGHPVHRQAVSVGQVYKTNKE